jgi:hypothetical protein
VDLAVRHPRVRRDVRRAITTPYVRDVSLRTKTLAPSDPGWHRRQCALRFALDSIYRAPAYGRLTQGQRRRLAVTGRLEVSASRIAARVDRAAHHDRAHQWRAIQDLAIDAMTHVEKTLRPHIAAVAPELRDSA